MTISKDVTRIVLAGMGIASLASLVYLAGPLIAIGGFRPFESYFVRQITIVLIVTAASWKSVVSRTDNGVCHPMKC